MRFQDLASTLQNGGEAWVNAGNAWFQAGEIGRAIVAYRSAQMQRPFDPQLAQSLAAARASALNDVPDTRTYLQKIPLSWLKLSTLLLNLLFWGSLLITIRYRNRSTLLASTVIAICLLSSISYLALRSKQSKPTGSIVVDSVYAKKGPGYAYANAFNESLYDGLECSLLEARGEWRHIQLNDKRSCWVPHSSVQFIEN